MTKTSRIGHPTLRLLALLALLGCCWVSGGLLMLEMAHHATSDEPMVMHLLGADYPGRPLHFPRAFGSGPSHPHPKRESTTREGGAGSQGVYVVRGRLAAPQFRLVATIATE